MPMPITLPSPLSHAPAAFVAAGLHAVRIALDVVAVSRLAPPPVGMPQAGWVDPDGTAWVGRGAAAIFRAGDRESRQFGVESDGATALDACRLGVASVTGDAKGLRAFGAMAFDPTRPVDALGGDVPVARFTVPRWLLRVPAEAVTAGGTAEAWVVLPVGLAATAEIEALRRWAATAVEPVAVPPVQSATDGEASQDYEELVRGSLAAIASGEVEKVVAARPRYIEAAAHLPVWTLFWELAARAPGTMRFALAPGDGTAFLGASPERLVTLDGDRVLADVLAGTAARSSIPAEDLARGEDLLASVKDAHEHAVVLDAVLAALAPLADDLTMPDAPALLGLPTVWHLRTPVTARLRAGRGLGDLVRALHPTPAVGGAPRVEALAVIRRLELTGRGLYAGPVGWVSADAALLAVGLRSAHIRGNRVAAMVGAGIVAGSDPQAEWQETERKLMPMLAALTGGVLGGFTA